MHEDILPKFSTIDLLNFPNQLQLLLNQNLEEIAKILANSKIFTWENLMEPLENAEDAIDRLWSPISHLNSVASSKALRNCYKKCLPKLTKYEALIGQNKILYQAIQSIKQDNLNKTQKKIYKDYLRNFHLAGVGLAKQSQTRFTTIQKKLSKLTNKFADHVLDSEEDFKLHVTDPEMLRGIPHHALEIFKKAAAPLDGWLLTIDVPSYHAIITYADDRKLRKLIYEAYITRASPFGPSRGAYNNNIIIQEILSLRAEKAILLGFNNYAEYSLATKMAESPKQVMEFLYDLKDRAYEKAKQEFRQLEEFAHKYYGIDKVESWDVAYLSEKQRQMYCAIAEEELRPYFPLKQVLIGLFEIVKRLYNISFSELSGVDVWHESIKCYKLTDHRHRIIGYIYMDLFAREKKRGGAWMDSFRSRRKLSHNLVQLPIAVLNCNFTKPQAGQTETLVHEEVITLFHELGHCLHHVLTKVDYYSAAGMQGVEWDAVELPSQFFEHWCWALESIAMLTKNIHTGAPMPQELLIKLVNAKNFLSSMFLMRQLEFALFDFELHQSTNPLVKEVLKKIRKEVRITPVAEFDHFECSFAHIFGGGYAAGYYSYLWAEVLSSDAYSRFEEEGVFNSATGADFLHNILAVGSSITAKEAFLNFRGRMPKIDIFLRHKGII